MDLGSGLRDAAGRLRRGWRFVVETTLAATVAWVVAAVVLGHPLPFFAPTAALLVLGAAQGQRRWRAVEVVLGVAGGVLVADVVAVLLGPGTTLTVAVVIALTALTAVALGASTVLLVQAMVSAVYVALVAPPTHGWIPTRFADALVGGGVALLVTLVVGAREPLRPAARAAEAVLAEAAAIVRDLVAALDDRDEPAAVAALARARNADHLVDALSVAAQGARESLWFSTRGHRRTDELERITAAATQCDYLVRNLRVMARSTVVLVRDGAAEPQPLLGALGSLAAALSLAAESFEHADLLTDARAAAVASATQASASLPHDVVLQQVTLVGQVRAAAIDLLRATGVTDRRSIDLVDEAMTA